MRRSIIGCEGRKYLDLCVRYLPSRWSHIPIFLCDRQLRCANVWMSILTSIAYYYLCDLPSLLSPLPMLLYLLFGDYRTAVVRFIRLAWLFSV